jgi:hypothetical protein
VLPGFVVGLGARLLPLSLRGLRVLAAPVGVFTTPARPFAVAEDPVVLVLLFLEGGFFLPLEPVELVLVFRGGALISTGSWPGPRCASGGCRSGRAPAHSRLPCGRTLHLPRLKRTLFWRLAHGQACHGSLQTVTNSIGIKVQQRPYVPQAPCPYCPSIRSDPALIRSRRLAVSGVGGEQVAKFLQ